MSITKHIIVHGFGTVYHLGVGLVYGFVVTIDFYKPQNSLGTSSVQMLLYYQTRESGREPGRLCFCVYEEEN